MERWGLLAEGIENSHLTTEPTAVPVMDDLWGHSIGLRAVIHPQVDRKAFTMETVQARADVCGGTQLTKRSDSRYMPMRLQKRTNCGYIARSVISTERQCQLPVQSVAW